MDQHEQIARKAHIRCRNQEDQPRLHACGFAACDRRHHRRAAQLGAIAALMKMDRMTPERFAEALASLRWTQRGLAAILECDDRLVRRWAAGSAEIPASIAAWLETLAQAHDAIPPPRGWKRR